MRRLLVAIAIAVAPLCGAASAEGIEQPEPSVFVLLSFSMPAGQLRATLASLQESETPVFRGFPPGENAKTVAKRLQELNGAHDEAMALQREIANAGAPTGEEARRLARALGPAVARTIGAGAIIDPTVFDLCAVAVVPAVCIKVGERFAALRGTANPEVLRDRLLRGLDIAQNVGPTLAILEPDPRDALRRALQAARTRPRDAAAEVWAAHQFVRLPRAVEDRAFEFDPALKVDRDLTWRDRVEALKGASYSPLPATGLSKRYLVFDASDPAQTGAAQKAYERLVLLGKPVRVLVSDVPDRSRGGAELAELGTRFGQRITVIDPLFAKAFRLQALPSVAESVGGRIRVNEIGVVE